MVKNIDIHSLTLDELTGVVSIYPWYGAARVQLFRRMSEMGALSSSQISQTSLYVGSRRILFNILNAGRKADCQDRSRTIPEQKQPQQPSSGRIFIVGGDYFSREQYDQAREPQDGIFSRFASKPRDEGYEDPLTEFSLDDIYTETLAQIYLDQDYPDQAIDIYSKLSLRYPEKSVYFATLIEEINKKRK